ncbi:BnaC03g41170D [Brassica napus]|uniref:BnaC03g41170D protein n=1 Tax=Brassica napus TaxID=3708 RepID=A0A078GD21_BRANA|nr:BnaC03g41170D [Brassica napus]
MSLLCDLQINLNQDFTFFVNKGLISEYSGFLKKMIKQNNNKNNIIILEDFPGGSNGFDLVSRFLKFLEGMFYWSWNDIVSCLKSCEHVFLHADSYGLVDKLVFGVLAKISQGSDMSQVFASLLTSSSASTSLMSPETSKTRSTSRSFSCQTSNEWWFDDLSSLGPKIVEKLVKNLGAYDQNNDSLVLTRFLLHYLKTKVHYKSNNKLEYAGLADTAVQGVIFIAKTAFCCRKLLWILRVLSGFSISKESRNGLERVIGEICNTEGDEDLKFRRMGKLTDKYLREISPDQNLEVSKFLEVAESLPGSARDWFDGLFRAIDIYLESHPNLSSEDRTKLCRCLNYKKLTLEICKQLAKNLKIPPSIAVQALKSQQLSNELPDSREDKIKLNKTRNSRKYLQEKPILVRLKGFGISERLVDGFEDDLRVDLERRHWHKVMDHSEKICKEKKSEIVSRLASHGHFRSSSNFPRLC